LVGIAESEYTDYHDDLLTNSSIDSEFSTPISERFFRSAFELIEQNLMRKYEQLLEEQKKNLLKQFNDEVHKQLSTLQSSLLEDFNKKKVNSFRSPLKKTTEPAMVKRNPLNNNNNYDPYAKLRPAARKLHFSSESETFSATINRK